MRDTRVISVILLGVGIAVLSSSFLVELTPLSDDPGLGFRQIVGIVTGCVVIIAGTVLRLEKRGRILILRVLGFTLLAGGTVVFLGSLFIDLAGFHTNPGFGLKQIAGIVTGVFVLVVGGFSLFKFKTLAG